MTFPLIHHEDEGMKRGQPDLIKRVPTPPGGLPGSQGSLLLRSLSTGIPGHTWSTKWIIDDPAVYCVR